MAWGAVMMSEPLKSEGSVPGGTSFQVQMAAVRGCKQERGSDLCFTRWLGCCEHLGLEGKGEGREHSEEVPAGGPGLREGKGALPSQDWSHSGASHANSEWRRDDQIK